jgi:hypothetical protein
MTFVRGSERHLHHILCNFSSEPRDGCKQCLSLFRNAHERATRENVYHSKRVT